jgi:hypothetical protein
MNFHSLKAWLASRLRRAPLQFHKRPSDGAIRVRRGDLVVVRTTAPVTARREQEMREQFVRTFPGARILVVDAHTDFDVYGAD